MSGQRRKRFRDVYKENYPARTYSSAKGYPPGSLALFLGLFTEAPRSLMKSGITDSELRYGLFYEHNGGHGLFCEFKSLMELSLRDYLYPELIARTAIAGCRAGSNC